MARPSDRPGWIPEPARSASQVVLLLLDGLGWDQLAERRAHAPALSSFQGGPITSVAPTTTATALSSVVTGSTPADHGVVGYRLRVQGLQGDDEILNVLRWRTRSGDARSFVEPAGFCRVAAFGGHPVPVVSRVEFIGTGFTLAHQRGARDVGYAVPSGIAVEVGALLRAGNPFVYAYYDGVDKVAHRSGFGDHYDAELRAADRLVDDLRSVLPPGAALVVTADHGQVSVGEQTRVLAPEVLEGTTLISGEARFRWLHVRPGAQGDVLDAARHVYGHEAWVLSEDEVVSSGWFGGPLHAEVRVRIGDVAIVPHAPVGYLDPADTGEVRLVCRHGSLTAAEMLVPLLAAGSD
jgi:predicted AlkP superfamily pyrophosphatase or phosphodiesterase